MARVSNYIDRRQAGNFQKAIEQAERIGRPLNLFVSINFRYTRCRAENASACFRRILKHHFSQWLSYKSKKSRRLNFGKPTFVWVVENKPGDHGAHWLVHVPHSLQSEFKEKLPKWLEKCAGPVLCPRSIKIKPAPTPEGRRALYAERHQSEIRAIL